MWQIFEKLLDITIMLYLQLKHTGGHGAFRFDVVVVDVETGADLEREAGPSLTV